MNKQEFNELQNEFGQYVYRYEYFIKKGYLLDLRYNYTFYDILYQTHKIEIECGLLQSILKMNEENKSEKEISNFVEKVLNDYKDKENKIVEKYNFSKIVIDNYDKQTQDEKEDFEKYYEDYVINFSPIVKIMVPKTAKPIVDTLKSFYNNNNIDGFKELFELNKEIFRVIDIPEEQYNGISAFYYQNKLNINKDYNQKVSKYPYNKEKVFDNDMSIKAEEGELLIHLSNVKKLCNALHKDYESIYGKDAEFIFSCTKK
ncbi:MAG: hypothetical protein ACI35S_10050 [Anaeroplasma sp.]